MFKLVRMERLEVTDMNNSRNYNLAGIRRKEDSSPIVEIKLYGKNCEVKVHGIFERTGCVRI